MTRAGGWGLFVACAGNLGGRLGSALSYGWLQQFDSFSAERIEKSSSSYHDIMKLVDLSRSMMMFSDQYETLQLAKLDEVSAG